MNVVVTGANGQLGRVFKSLTGNNSNYNFLTSGDLDITHFSSVETYFENNTCDVLINCAAYTKVDEAELEVEKAFSVNKQGVENLIIVCAKFDIKLIHFSTDYVFDGKNENPYKENYKTSPINVYGKSKLDGEDLIRNSKINATIIRTSWLYSIYGKNFVKTIIKLAMEKESIKVISDQYGSPTNAKDLALAVIDIISQKKYNAESAKGVKTFHYSNSGLCSWYELAKKIVNLKKINLELKKISTEEYKTKAKRPKYSILDSSEIRSFYNVKIYNWEHSLRNMLTELSDCKDAT